MSESPFKKADTQGDSAIQLARKSEWAELQGLLRQKDKKQVRGDANGHTALMASVMRGAPLEVLDALLASGADVNAQEKWGTSVLQLACGQGASRETLVWLLQSGAEAGYKDRNGNTALHALRYDPPRPDTDRGSNMASSALGYSQQSVTAMQGLIALLVEAGAPLDLQDRWGNTAMMAAVMRNDMRAVEAFIAAGAAMNVANKAGNTPKTALEEKLTGKNDNAKWRAHCRRVLKSMLAAAVAPRSEMLRKADTQAGKRRGPKPVV